MDGDPKENRMIRMRNLPVYTGIFSRILTFPCSKREKHPELTRFPSGFIAGKGNRIPWLLPSNTMKSR